MSFLEGCDATIGHAIPQLNAAVLAAGDIHVGARVVANGTDGISVLVLGIARDKTLEGVDIIKAECRMLSPNQDKVP